MLSVSRCQTSDTIPSCKRLDRRTIQTQDGSAGLDGSISEVSCFRVLSWFLLFVLEIFSPKFSPGVLERSETPAVCTVLGNYSAIMLPG